MTEAGLGCDLRSDFDRTIHQATRFRIAVYLYVAGRTTFSELADALALTNGNANSHLDRLEEAGYVAPRRTFHDGRPRTFYRLTDGGRTAVERHLDLLDQIASATPTTPGASQHRR